MDETQRKYPEVCWKKCSRAWRCRSVEHSSVEHILTVERRTLLSEEFCFHWLKTCSTREFPEPGSAARLFLEEKREFSGKLAIYERRNLGQLPEETMKKPHEREKWRLLTYRLFPFSFSKGKGTKLTVGRETVRQTGGWIPGACLSCPTTCELG